VIEANLTFVRHEGAAGLFLWVQGRRKLPPSLQPAFSRGQRCEDVPLAGPNKRGKLKPFEATGWWLPAAEAMRTLAALPMATLRDLSPSVGVWALASKWVVEAVQNEQVVPYLAPGDDDGVAHAAWRAAPVRREDRLRITGLLHAMPGAARAWIAEDNGQGPRVLTAGAALAEFIDAAADGLVRAPTEETAPLPAEGDAWVRRLGRALSGPRSTFELQGISERHLPQNLARWTAPVTTLGAGDRPMVSFRLDEPPSADEPWRVSFHLLSPTGESRVAVQALKDGDEGARALAATWRRPEETLLASLARCSRVFPPLERALSEGLPASVEVGADEAWEFLTKAGLRLERGGYPIEIPRALSRVGQRRVRARIRVGVRSRAADENDRGGSKLLEQLIHYQWEASLGDDTLTAKEFLRLAKSAAPLVYHRGRWIAVDPNDVARLKALIQKGGGTLGAAEALRLALAGEVDVPDAPGDLAEVVCDGSFARAVNTLQSQGLSRRKRDLDVPKGLQATLRPYQTRGYSWLEMVTSLGFGACLADDMGLGKTVQALALMQRIHEARKRSRFLVVSPTSVIGNWRREIHRFAPELRVVVHHGPGRAQSMREFRRRCGDEGGAVVITSYALVRGDEALMTRFTFDLVVLDEAQNIKNPEAGQSKAVRKLVARRRAALTGTPVENRLAELWSIMDFLNPGLLGTRTGFRKQFALPVERYGDTEVAERLRKVTSPFILRRTKQDPTIAPELPEKDELVRYCPLTREQAALYQATIERGLQEIAAAEAAMERRGRVLAMLTALKQICNHPAHFLKDGKLSPRRSGKFIRFLELLDEVLDQDGHALVFTQYRVMGEILSQVVSERLKIRAPFLHGGLNRTRRDRMVADFQSKHGPPVLVVSLRAGGTGLNLTRANHVFHYDRWWNPAVEDQATDRAFRIGQHRDVTVHRLVSQGTLEEHIDQLLNDKRALAERIIGTDETWISELDDSALAELVKLGQDAVLEDDP